MIIKIGSAIFHSGYIGDNIMIIKIGSDIFHSGYIGR